PRVAFLFPGQGSQYTGMLQSLLHEFAPARDALARLDAVLSRLSYPSFAQAAWESPEGLGQEVWQTQHALLAADTLLFTALTALGIRPDCVAGHSFGQFPALLAAGAWTFAAAAQATRARCALIEDCPQARGIMMAIGAPTDVVERFRSEFDGRIAVATRNAA